jgi:hypothetical protein
LDDPHVAYNVFLPVRLAFRGSRKCRAALAARVVSFLRSPARRAKSSAARLCSAIRRLKLSQAGSGPLPWRLGRQRMAQARSSILGRQSARHGRWRMMGWTAEGGRVETWRGGVRSSMSVSAPFVWRCLSGSTIAPFPRPAHRTGRADFPHPALGQDLTPSFACNAIGSF